MFELIINEYFSAAHNLQGYQGQCENLHGHNWKVQVVVQAKKLNKIGLAIDFKDLKKHVKNVLAYLDHHYINDVPTFKKINPSAENISKFIYNHLKKALKQYKNIKLLKVISWEGMNSGAVYYE